MPLKDAPVYNKQHAVPQNIMDVEFKLIGDLTMRQFFYVLIFFGIAYGIFNLGIPTIFKWPLIIINVLLGLGFAFVPIEDRGLDEWIVNFFKATYSESQKIWKKEPTPPSAFLYENISAIQHELITLTPTASRRKLEQYIQDQYTAKSDDPYDVLEESYIMKVKEAFAQAPAITPPTAPVAVAEPTSPTIAPTTVLQPSRAPTPLTAPAKAPPKQPKKQAPVLPREAEDIVMRPITPDRHAGRRFTSLLPSQGTIILPIRGERVLRPIEIKEPDADTVAKAQQLKDYMEQIKGTEMYAAAEEAQKLITKMQAENLEIEKQITTLRDQPEKVDEIKALESKRKEAIETITKLQQQLGRDSKPGEIPARLHPQTPNAISGIVRNIQGRALSDVILVIKNNKGEPVRALKTNNLGEFSISNPLVNGQYKIEVDVNGSTGFRFDIMEFEARGEIIPAIEFVGK